VNHCWRKAHARTNGLTRIDGSLARAKRLRQEKASYSFLRDGGGATAWSVGGVGSDATPPENIHAEQHIHPFVDDAYFVPREPEPFVSRPSARFTNRSHGFLLAYDLFHQIEESLHSSTLEPYQIYSRIMTIFERWLKTYENSYIKLVNPKDRKLLLNRVVCRFIPEYKKRLWKRYGFLDQIHWDLMLTLTVDPKAFSRLAGEFALVMKGWDKLRSAIRKVCGDFRFIRVLEIQKTGRPHLHILISGISHIPKEWIMELWSRYGIGLQVHIGAVRRHDLRGLCYVMKYLKKTTRTFGKDRLYSSLLFASNRRQWGFSIRRRFDLTIHQEQFEPKSEYEFGGFAHVNDVICYCCKRGIPFRDTIFIRDDEHFLEGLG